VSRWSWREGGRRAGRDAHGEGRGKRGEQVVVDGAQRGEQRSALPRHHRRRRRWVHRHQGQQGGECVEEVRRRLTQPVLVRVRLRQRLRALRVNSRTLVLHETLSLRFAVEAERGRGSGTCSVERCIWLRLSMVVTTQPGGGQPHSRGGSAYPRIADRGTENGRGATAE
jgi:hypothetical protein